MHDTQAFPNDSVFVDFGCGKGRALLVASKYSFKRLVGIEFSHELCEVAKENLSIYRKKTGIAVDVEIVESDVVDYDIREDENVFFLFNPFDVHVLRKVIENIKMSLQQKPRKIWLLYENLYPGHREYIEGLGIFVKLNEYGYGSSRLIVYNSNN